MRAGNNLPGRKSMRPIIAFAAIALLAGCGVETATTAATVAAAKKQELEQGKKTMEQMQQNIGKSMEQTQQSAERADEASK
jgi:curli biogenesis system outer membrane secretion channel CsgG